MLAQHALQLVAKCHSNPRPRLNETESLLARMSYPVQDAPSPSRDHSPAHSGTSQFPHQKHATPLM